MKRSPQFLSLYVPSYRETPRPLICFLRVWSFRLFVSVIFFILMVTLMEMALRLRGW